jgi:hypothetical protein
MTQDDTDTWNKIIQYMQQRAAANQQNPTNATPLNFGSLGDIASIIQAYQGMNNNIGAIQNTNASNQSYLDNINSQVSSLGDQLKNMPTLDSLYGQNSPYAQALRQKLGATDAAAGRNSQYGQREVQLQAALADKASTYLNQQGQLANLYANAMNTARQTGMNIGNNINTNTAAITNQQGQGLGAILNSLNKMGVTAPINSAIDKGLGQVGSMIGSGLGSIFGGNQSQGTPSLNSNDLHALLSGSGYGGIENTSSAADNRDSQYYSGFTPTRTSGMMDPMQSQQPNNEDYSWMQ